jgi:hypothetical protein
MGRRTGLSRAPGLPLLEGHDAVDAAVDEGCGAAQVRRVVAQPVEHGRGEDRGQRRPLGIPVAVARRVAERRPDVVRRLPQQAGAQRGVWGEREERGRAAQRLALGQRAQAGLEREADALAQPQGRKVRVAQGAEHHAVAQPVPLDGEVERAAGGGGARLGQRDLGVAGGLGQRAVDQPSKGTCGRIARRSAVRVGSVPKSVPRRGRASRPLPIGPWLDRPAPPLL